MQPEQRRRRGGNSSVAAAPRARHQSKARERDGEEVDSGNDGVNQRQWRHGLRPNGGLGPEATTATEGMTSRRHGRRGEAARCSGGRSAEQRREDSGSALSSGVTSTARRCQRPRRCMHAAAASVAARRWRPSGNGNGGGWPRQPRRSSERDGGLRKRDVAGLACDGRAKAPTARQPGGGSGVKTVAWRSRPRARRMHATAMHAAARRPERG